MKTYSKGFAVDTNRCLGKPLVEAGRLALFCSLAASPTLQAAGPRFQGVGDLPGGSVASIALAVSADGTTVVGSSASSNGTEAFRWRDGKLEGLGSLGEADGKHNGTPEGWIARISRNELLNGPGTHLTVKVACLDICWNSEVGKTYQVQYRSQAGDATWINLGSPIAGNGTVNCFTDTPADTVTRFYQVVESP